MDLTEGKAASYGRREPANHRFPSDDFDAIAVDIDSILSQGRSSSLLSHEAGICSWRNTPRG